MKREEDAHLQLMQQMEEFKAKAELIRDNSPSSDGSTPTVLDLPEDPDGVYDDLTDLQDMLKHNPPKSRQGQDCSPH